MVRKRIYDIIEKNNEKEKWGKIYDFGMIVVIILSLIPLLFKKETPLLLYMDKITVIIFILDYFLRWVTADYKYNKRGIVSFVKYPFSIMALIDLLSIIPSLTVVNRGIKVVRVLRMIRAMRVIRVFKSIRYSKSMDIIIRVIKNSKESLTAVGVLAIGYILISAILVFNFEPNSFKSFFDAVYWATVSLMTVGYGDIYPVSNLGRIITMLSSFFGVAVVALPAGIITAGYMKEID